METSIIIFCRSKLKPIDYEAFFKRKSFISALASSVGPTAADKASDNTSSANTSIFQGKYQKESIKNTISKDTQEQKSNRDDISLRINISNTIVVDK